MFGAWWRASRTQPEVGPRPFLTRLTSDVGWTDYPAISLDGKMLAYASDRSGEGNLDIWVQQIPDGSPVRLTRHAADDVEPSFSADGSRVAFQSSRLGGGIYVIPTLGGEERLLAARGFSPRFSPDGNWIAYGVAEQAGGRLYVAPAAGGPATPVAAGFYRAQAPVWSPDGRYLLFWAQRERDAPPENNIDWYVAAVPGGSPVRHGGAQGSAAGRIPGVSGAAVPRCLGERGKPHPLSWHRRGLLEHVAGCHLSRELARQRDAAAGDVRHDRRSGGLGDLGRTDGVHQPDDGGGHLEPADRRKPRRRWRGPLKRVTQDAADDYDPTLSEDGATLVFRSRRAGRFGVVLRRLGTSAETVLTRMPEDHYPAVSRDGTKVAYSFRQNDKMPIFVVAASGGTPEQVCDDCGEVEAWSPAGDQILYVAARDPSGVGLLTLGSSHNHGWLRNPGYGIYNPRLSSDGGWIAFNGRTDRLAPAQVLVARVQASVVAREKDWIVVSRMAMRRAGRQTQVSCTSGRIATALRACGHNVSIRRRSGRPGCR